MECKICSSQVIPFCTKILLKKYSISYYQCPNCGLIQTERPYWLKEAYSSAIIDSDTGLISRNIILSKISSIIILLFSGKNSKVLDYAGGYGIMTRLLRDIGIDCYLQDKYAKNILAKGFESKDNKKYDVVTAFEYFEHIEDPIKEVDKISKTYKPKLLIFSTMLHNDNPPKDWWYFVPEGGQHITFYTKKSLFILAHKNRMKFSTNGRNLHIFSKKYIPGLFLLFISVFWPLFYPFTKFFYKSKTISDRLLITSIK